MKNTNNKEFSSICYTKFRYRLDNYCHVSSFEDAVKLSDKYIKIGDNINAIHSLRGWGIKAFYESRIMNDFMKYFLSEIKDTELKKLYTPYKHKTYYLGVSKMDVIRDLFLSVVSYGNDYSEKWVVTNGAKIPITKTMYNALLIMIDIVNNKLK